MRINIPKGEIMNDFDLLSKIFLHLLACSLIEENRAAVAGGSGKPLAPFGLKGVLSFNFLFF